MPDKSRSEKVQSALGAFRKGYTLGGVAGRALSGRERMAKKVTKKVTQKLGSTGAERKAKIQYESRKGSGPPKVGPAPVVNIGPKQGGPKASPRKPKKATKARGVRKVAAGY